MDVLTPQKPKLYLQQHGWLGMTKNHFKSKSCGLLLLATGLGKTYVAAQWLLEEFEENPNLKVLILCNNTDILDQTRKKFSLFMNPKEYRMHSYFGTRKDLKRSQNAHIVYASFQTMNNTNYGKKYLEFAKDHFDIIIVDEAHHEKAETYEEVTTYFKPKFRLGLTATPKRMDGKDIKDIYGEDSVIVEITFDRAIAAGWLTPINYKLKLSNLATKKLQELAENEGVINGERISIKQLNHTVFVKERDAVVAQEIRNEAKGRKTVIYCQSVRAIKKFMKNFDESKCAEFHSHMSPGVNEKTLQGWRDGKTQFLFSVNKLNEGIHAPDAEVLVFLRATDSQTIFEQQLGRALSKQKGKDQVLVLDYVANADRILYVSQMIDNIKEEQERIGLTNEVIVLEGAGFHHEFTTIQLNILEYMKTLRAGFYPTLEEAKGAVKDLGIKTYSEYLKQYRQDLRLPSDPDRSYSEWISWYDFLGKDTPIFLPYEDLKQEVQEAGITGHREYMRVQEQHANWPAIPWDMYKDQYSHEDFFCARFLSYEDLKKEVQEAGITMLARYIEEQKNHPKWPSNPWSTYKDQYSHEDFFCARFLSYEDLKKEVQEAGITMLARYIEEQKNHPKWPSNPWSTYKDQYSTEDFISRFLSYEDLKKEVQEAGIRTIREYREVQKNHSRWPFTPWDMYKDQYSYDDFFVSQYLSYEDLKKEVQRAGITERIEYKKVQKSHDNWTAEPWIMYKDQYSHEDFFCARFLSYEDLKKEVQEAGVTNRIEYKEAQKKHANWPAHPWKMYKYQYSGKDFFVSQYLSYEDLKKEVQEAGITTAKGYKEAQKKHANWPSTPYRKYQDQYSHEDFFGKK